MYTDTEMLNMDREQLIDALAKMQSSKEAVLKEATRLATKLEAAEGEIASLAGDCGNLQHLCEVKDAQLEEQRSLVSDLRAQLSAARLPCPNEDCQWWKHQDNSLCNIT